MYASAKFEEAIKDNLAELEDSRLITTKNKDARFQMCDKLKNYWEVCVGYHSDALPNDSFIGLILILMLF
jgi:hypothetical protein